MKRCPACRKVLPDDAMVVCPYDGTPLLDTMTSSNSLADTIEVVDNNSTDSTFTDIEKSGGKQADIKPNEKVLTAPIPDIRVTVRAAVALLPLRGTVKALAISVQNHSPITMFLSNIVIETHTNEQLYFPKDHFTGEWQKRRELRSGESFSFYIDPEEVKKFSEKGFICAAVKDDIDRIYRSTEAELQNALKQLS